MWGEEAIFTFQKILVPTDGSPYSLKAAEYAAEISKQFGVAAQLVHIISPTTMRASRKREEKLALKALERTKEVFERVEADVVIREVIRGNPAEIICHIAEEEKFDLIVIGSRGLSGIKAFFLGGISEKVSQHAVCPVLIVR
jgi:nucleotide-binding universal stress UspA family protein